MNSDELARGAALLAAATPVIGHGMTEAERRTRETKLAAWLRTHAAELLADAWRYQWLRMHCRGMQLSNRRYWEDNGQGDARDFDTTVDNAARTSGADEP